MCISTSILRMEISILHPQFHKMQSYTGYKESQEISIFTFVESCHIAQGITQSASGNI